MNMPTDPAGIPSASGELIRRVDFSFRTLDEAQRVAAIIVSMCPDPERRHMGLTELLINAVEHGNLEISHEQKTALLLAGGWHDEIVGRLEQQPFAARRVAVVFERFTDRIDIRIEDEGPGFDHSKFGRLELADNVDLSGRGISLARQMSFDDVVYEGRGNLVVARIRLGENR
jgi:anti-sigma regulatory factor (Ser/Thr protein kinase)